MHCGRRVIRGSWTAQVLHFHDSRIVNPDVRDELLQAISKLLQSKVRFAHDACLLTGS